MRVARGAGVLRSIWGQAWGESLKIANGSSFLLSENAMQLRRCLRASPENCLLPLTGTSSSSRCSSLLLPLRLLSTSGAATPPSPGAAASSTAAASASGAKSQGSSDGPKPVGAASTEDFFSSHEEGFEASDAGASSRPRSFFWNAARLAFSTAFLATAGGVGYVTYGTTCHTLPCPHVQFPAFLCGVYNVHSFLSPGVGPLSFLLLCTLCHAAYDTSSVKGWVEEKRKAFNARHPDTAAQLADHSLGSAWVRAACGLSASLALPLCRRFLLLGWPLRLFSSCGEISLLCLAPRRKAMPAISQETILRPSQRPIL